MTTEELLANIRVIEDFPIKGIHFQDITTDPKVVYTESRDTVVPLVECPFFTTNELKLTRAFKRDYTGIDSFRVYMCLSGQSCFLQGESLVVPAAMQEDTIVPDENAKLLESYVE